MAKIEDLRILPPIAIGRFGSASEPLDNYTLEDDPDHPLGYRRIRPAPTLVVNDAGEVAEKPLAGTIEFTAMEDGEGGERVRIRPVAPFLEVFAKLEGRSELVPLSVGLLAEAGVTVEDVRWSAQVANRKVVRRTGDDDDQVSADTGWVSGHESVELRGKCANFLEKENAWINFGHVRLIRPTESFPEIRLRFTPPKGLIYGPGCAGPAAGCKCGGAVENDPVIPAERRVYDCRKSWYGFDSNEYEPPEGEGRLGYENATLPPSLFAISSPAPSWLNDNIAISRGYLDDASDGFVNVALTLRSGATLTASARICVGPPDVAPDSLFLRTLADDLEQVIHGPELSPDEDPETTRQRAAEIVRRAFETVRFMNVAVLNGNDIKGRSALKLDSMPQEEAADTERALRPVMPPETVDTFTIAALHEQVYAALRGGAAPWFDRLIRRPEEVSDLTDYGRRKMPALMCGADNNYLALTHRQIDTILKAASPARSHAGRQAAAGKADASKLKARNRTAELNHVAAGNPISSRPVTSVANCCPGLEMDFRAVWRRLFKGVELREYDNLVIACSPDESGARPLDLVGHRLLRVVLPDDGSEVAFTALITGPATSDVEGQIVLTTSANPEGLAPLEWSNALATVLRTYQGRTVRCDFTREPSKPHQSLQAEPPNFVSHELEVRPFFDEDTAVIARALAEPGELTQGLCSPWQNDYRECSCYYWASARPDFVNVEPGRAGFSAGDNWLQKSRTGHYVPDDYLDSRLIDYDDLFRDWERLLRFQIGGRDVPDSGVKKTP